MLWWKVTAMVEPKDRKFPFTSLSLSFLIQKAERGRIGVRIWWETTDAVPTEKGCMKTSYETKSMSRTIALLKELAVRKKL